MISGPMLPLMAMCGAVVLLQLGPVLITMPCIMRMSRSVLQPEAKLMSEGCTELDPLLTGHSKVVPAETGA